MGRRKGRERASWQETEGVNGAHPIREVHFHSKDADILGTGLRGVSGGAVNGGTVSEDTGSRGHFWKERKRSSKGEERMKEKRESW